MEAHFGVEPHRKQTHLGRTVSSHYITTAHDLHLPGRADLFPIVYDLAHVAVWDPYNVHDLAHVSWVDTIHILHNH